MDIIVKHFIKMKTSCVDFLLVAIFENSRARTGILSNFNKFERNGRIVNGQPADIADFPPLICSKVNTSVVLNPMTEEDRPTMSEINETTPIERLPSTSTANDISLLVNGSLVELLGACDLATLKSGENTTVLVRNVATQTDPVNYTYGFSELYQAILALKALFKSAVTSEIESSEGKKSQICQRTPAHIEKKSLKIARKVVANVTIKITPHPTTRFNTIAGGSKIINSSVLRSPKTSFRSKTTTGSKVAVSSKTIGVNVETNIFISWATNRSETLFGITAAGSIFSVALDVSPIRIRNEPIPLLKTF